MKDLHIEDGPITLILGAGASRSVKYKESPQLKSPLDGDFFELLQRLEAKERDEPSVKFVIEECLRDGTRLWESMERMFYTLHLRATTKQLFGSSENDPQYSPQDVLDHFSRAIQALLRAAHGIQACSYHRRLFKRLNWKDAIVSFNYDLVVERALRSLDPQCIFGEWIYGFEARPRDSNSVPTVFKLHGSSNWKSGENQFEVRQKSWEEFAHAPGYSARGPEFPILLPFWDKKIEQEPWLTIWRSASAHLSRSRTVLIWGYSLPITDLKARELFRLTLQSAGAAERVCVVDPSVEVQRRWREMFIHQKFWAYSRIDDFFESPPVWWPRERVPE